MGIPGGKINRPKTELRKKLFKRRRVSSLPNKKKRHIVNAVVDEGRITIHHLKKRSSSAPPRITLSGKEKMKLLKQLCHTTRETEMQVDTSLGTKKTIGKTKEKQACCPDVEMRETEAAAESADQELPSNH